MADASLERGCDCEGRVAEYILSYSGNRTITVEFTKQKNGDPDGGEYDVRTLTPTDTEPFSIFAQALGRTYFKKNTGVRITNETGDVLCTSDSGLGKIRECDTDIIGEEIKGCEGLGLSVDAFVDNEGYTCDATAVSQAAQDDASDSGDGFNALINGERAINSPFAAFNDLDPYIKWSLIGIMVTFLALIFVACYICVARKDENDKDLPKEQALEMEKVISNSEMKIKKTNVTYDEHGEDVFDDEYYDDGQEENHGNKRVNTKEDDDEYYNEDDENVLVQMDVVQGRNYNDNGYID